ncbi:endoplasmic reticulum membrane-associated RNA degradation protein isoform X2 [Xenopus laevis]|uniref:Endoplasmic reticulum membrane-associated RNA degradation protein isoform X2 n=1 Tax=Xenopus laevis TaxID=8355 RepID=A0A8J0VF79_XENLA|nr:endoplasmic reticulum membrane-associated RNA degradation protein isoform X2 [Xenopus laevis]
MLEPSTVSTCLSPAVHYMICKVGFELQGSYDIRRILTIDNEVCWEALSENMCYKATEFEEQFGWCFHWTENTELFLRAFKALKSLSGVNISLSMMKVTSCLERSLGDVYLMVGKECPFLLRDLLASTELAAILSKPVMDVLKVFLGSPESLNLRNILWHGFASPDDIPAKYCSTLLLLTAGLGQLLKTYLSLTHLPLEHRPYFLLNSPKDMQVFPSISDKALFAAELLIVKSKFALPHMTSFWIEAIAAFQQGRYADCVILLLPQLECSLRLVFTVVNKCPNRMLTAESAVLYTTFDEILTEQLDSGSENQVPYTLGEPAMEFLLDFLNHQEGPRIRDHLSHGEIQLNEFPKEIANQLMFFSLVMLYKNVEHEDVFFKEMADVFNPLINAVESYKSMFHPIALLQKQVIECCDSLQEWTHLPSPPDHSEQVRKVEGSADPGMLFTHETLYIISLHKHQIKDFTDVEDLDYCILTDKFTTMTNLCNKHIKKLFCHRWVVEVVGILRKVSTQLYLISRNVIFISELRYEQWMQKALRSRQRQNYIRMLYSIKILTPILRLFVMLVIVNMQNIHTILEKNLVDYQKYIKYLKSILQYAENMSSYTSFEKNRWDETIELTRRILLKITTFNDKHELSQAIKDNQP